ncbi:tRNA lysidine(34) synthetase TilS [Atlantibacter sp.]|uniref:tRNA lysidine(34) synthetase TilS n=1 Tax=Atlantibacter sp. TaxID=1903473 RepID=UPI0028AFA200|nr:tRNA lysidine(34) synthetase TilS [Atlantibacter sp.]
MIQWESHYRKVLVAFSGGLDSTVLLHQMAALRQQNDLQLRAVHIHHGISAFADEWVAHCQAICERWAVPLEVVRVTLQNDGSGIEAQARSARYAAFAQIIQPAEALVTAQHLDDQCETVLLALKRGSGPAGLAAMPETLPFGDNILLRPLLNTSREALEAYAQAHQLTWIDDDSNQDDRYDRNFLRLRVLPLLQARWPHFARSAARSAALCGEQEALLDELLADELMSLTTPEGSLTIAPLNEVSQVRRNALLRRWLTQRDAPPPSRAMLERIWQEVALSREDAAPRLQIGAFDVRRYQGQLWWIKRRAAPGRQAVIWEPPYSPLKLPLELGILRLAQTGYAVRAPYQDEQVSVRFHAPGNWQIVGRERSRNLKKLWQELSVPPWRRNTTPLLFYGEQLIAAPGIFVTRQGQAQDHACWHIDWQKGE